MRIKFYHSALPYPFQISLVTDDAVETDGVLLETIVMLLGILLLEGTLK